MYCTRRKNPWNRRIIPPLGGRGGDLLPAWHLARRWRLQRLEHSGGIERGRGRTVHDGRARDDWGIAGRPDGRSVAAEPGQKRQEQPRRPVGLPEEDTFGAISVQNAGWEERGQRIGQGAKQAHGTVFDH